MEGQSGGLLTRLAGVHWNLGALAEDGTPTGAGRLILVLMFSISCSLISVLIMRRPDPASLVPFYERVRPMGFWGPVRALKPGLEPAEKPIPVIVGSIGGSAAILGLLLTMGGFFLDRPQVMGFSALAGILGAAGLIWGMRTMAVSADSH